MKKYLHDINIQQYSAKDLNPWILESCVSPVSQSSRSEGFILLGPGFKLGRLQDFMQFFN